MKSNRNFTLKDRQTDLHIDRHVGGKLMKRQRRDNTNDAVVKIYKRGQT